MDRFLVKTEHKKTEPKKRQRAAVVRDDDDDDAVIVGKVEYDLHFMDQLANHIARQSGLVKLSDDGKKATYRRISGDDVYIKSGDAFVKVEDSAPEWLGDLGPARERCQLRRQLEPFEPVEKIPTTNPYDDFALPDDVLVSIPLP